MEVLTVKLELGDESRKLIETALAGLMQVSKQLYAIQANVASAGTPYEAPAPTKGEPVEAPAPVEPAPAEPEPVAQEEPAEEAPSYTVADIRQKVVDLSLHGHRDEVVAIVHQYADKVTSVPSNKYNELMSKLAALEG